MSILVATVNGRRDKNDVVLQELLDAGNWKQALVSVEKRLKKNNKNVGLVVSVGPFGFPQIYVLMFA